MSEFEPLLCPMPQCGEELLISYACTYGTLDFKDLDRAEQIDPADATNQVWTVECLAGHTLLIPGPTGCDCTDHDEGDRCPIEDLFDWGDPYEDRTFRVHDWARLRQVLALLGLGPGAS